MISDISLSRSIRCSLESSPSFKPPRGIMPSGKFDQFDRCALSENVYVAACFCLSSSEAKKILAAATIAFVFSSDSRGLYEPLRLRSTGAVFTRKNSPVIERLEHELEKKMTHKTVIICNIFMGINILRSYAVECPKPRSSAIHRHRTQFPTPRFIGATTASAPSRIPLGTTIIVPY